MPRSSLFPERVLQLKPNPHFKSEQGFREKIAEAALRYLDSSEGLLHFGQIAERGPMLANASLQCLGISRSEPLASCTAKSFASWTWLLRVPQAIVMTPKVVGDVKAAYRVLNDPMQSHQLKQYRFEKASCEAADAVSVYANSMANISSLFPRISKFSTAALALGETAGLIHNAINLKLNLDNYRCAASLELSNATQIMKETVEQTKTCNLWAVAKEVASVTTGIFAVMFFATETALLPEIALAVLLLASTIFSITRKLYEETMAFQPLVFIEQKSATRIR